MKKIILKNNYKNYSVNKKGNFMPFNKNDY